jgi:hypothetical protein
VVGKIRMAAMGMRAMRAAIAKRAVMGKTPRPASLLLRTMLRTEMHRAKKATAPIGKLKPSQQSVAMALSS